MAYADKKALLAQIQADIDKVKAARDKGVSSLKNKFLGGDAAQASIDAINALAIDAWAKRGTDAVASDKTPAANGWNGWKAAGETFISGINDLTDLGLTATLDNITATGEAVVADVKKKAAKVVAKTVVAAESVGSTISSSIHWIVAAVGLTLLALVIGRGR